MRFENQIAINAPRETVWKFIWDVDRFIACVPGCKEARTVEEGKVYTAVMEEKIGPFRVKFPMKIEVQNSDPPATIRARASGNDSKIGSLMKIELDAKLEEQGPGTLLSLVVNVEVLGKLAALGHSMIKRKADQVMAEFVEAIRKNLEGN